jgi:hypothetical protein
MDIRTGSDQYIGAIVQKSTTEVGKKQKQEYKHVRNCKSENPAAEKVDVLSFRTKNNRDVVVVW